MEERRVSDSVNAQPLQKHSRHCQTSAGNAWTVPSKSFPNWRFLLCKQLFATPFSHLTLVSWIFLRPYHLPRISPINLYLLALFIELLKPPLPGNLPRLTRATKSLVSLRTNHSPQRTSPLFPQDVNAAIYLLSNVWFE